MVRWLKGLLDSTGPKSQSHSADVTVAESRKFARSVAIRALGVNRQTANETLRNTKNSVGPFGSLRTEIVQLWRVAPRQTKDYALRLNFCGFVWRTIRREWFAITHVRRIMLRLSAFGNFYEVAASSREELTAEQCSVKLFTDVANVNNLWHQPS